MQIHDSIYIPRADGEVAAVCAFPDSFPSNICKPVTSRIRSLLLNGLKINFNVEEIQHFHEYQLSALVALT